MSKLLWQERGRVRCRRAEPPGRLPPGGMSNLGQATTGMLDGSGVTLTGHP